MSKLSMQTIDYTQDEDVVLADIKSLVSKGVDIKDSNEWVVHSSAGKGFYKIMCYLDEQGCDLIIHML